MDLVHRFRGPPTTLPSEAGTARALGLPGFVLFCFVFCCFHQEELVHPELDLGEEEGMENVQSDQPSQFARNCFSSSPETPHSWENHNDWSP